MEYGKIESSEKKQFTEEKVDKNKNFKKVGRNDKCPCGSGKKFKHCHGAL